MPWRLASLLWVAGMVLGTAAEPLMHLSDPLCIAQSFTRVSPLADLDKLPGSLRVALIPAGLAQAEIVEVSPGHRALHLRAKTLGSGELRLFDANQREVAHSQVQVVSMATTTTKWIADERTLADGSVIFHGELIMTPYVPGLDLRFTCLSSDNTVPDGLREWWAASETFTRTPAGTAWISFRMVRALSLIHI